MVQLQIGITWKGKKVRVEISQFRREDSEVDEIFVAKKLEEVFIDVWKHVAAEHGINPKIKAIKRERLMRQV